MTSTQKLLALSQHIAVGKKSSTLTQASKMTKLNAQLDDLTNGVVRFLRVYKVFQRESKFYSFVLEYFRQFNQVDRGVVNAQQQAVFLEKLTRQLSQRKVEALRRTGYQFLFQVEFN